MMSVAERRAGWWGVAFVVLLLAEAAMVSLPTGKTSGAQLKSFYDTHAQIILMQQLLGAIAMIPLVAFAISLGARRSPWLFAGTALVVITELATNALPLTILFTNPTAGAAHSLTLLEDLADSALFLAIAVLVIAASIRETRWLRAIGLLVAALSIVRAGLSPLGIDAIDQVAPIGFILFIVLLAARQILGKTNPPA